MIFHFQTRPLDLYLLLAVTGALSGVIWVTGAGNLFALLIALFSPGYVITAALFPRSRSLELFERLAISVGLSIAIVPIGGLLLTLTPFGISLRSTLVSLDLLVLLVGLLALWRRLQLEPGERVKLTVELSSRAWKSQPRVDKAILITLVCSALTAGIILAYVMTLQGTSERYTEFFVLGANGKVGSYPSRLNASENGTVVIGVTNLERQQTAYTIEVSLLGINVTNDPINGTFLVYTNRTTLAWFNLTLVDGEQWKAPFTFDVDTLGMWQVRFELFESGNLSTPYRAVWFNTLVS